MPGSSATNDIRAVKELVTVPGAWDWLWWLSGALVILAGLYLLWRWWCARQEAARQAAILPPHVRARQKLSLALQQLHEPRVFMFLVSDALRHYLEEQFQLKAPERTTEEFLADLQRTSQLSDPHKEALREFLEQSDLVKFARAEPSETSLRTLHDSALRLVDETSYEPVAPEGGAVR